MLPNCAELVDLSDVRQAHVDMARLPFPVVAIEAPWILPDGEGGDKQALRAPKRIALCLEMNARIASLLPSTAEFADEKEGGVCIVPIYWIAQQQSWQIGIGGVFVPHANSVSAYLPTEADERTRLVNQPFIDAGLSPKKLKQFRVAPFVVFPESYQHAIVQTGSAAAVHAEIIGNCRDEVSMLIQTGCVLNCANVRTVAMPPASALNKKRTAKGKTPFYEYRVLAIDEPRIGGIDGTGLNHASPRAHLRRGHIRRISPEKQIWVRAAIVNAGSQLGQVQKDYALRARPPVRE